MLTPRLRLGLIVAAFIAVGGAAVAGWVRKPTAPAEPVAYTTPAVNSAQDAAQPAASYDQYGQPIGNAAEPAGSYQAAGEQVYPGNQAYYRSPADGCQYPVALPSYADRSYVRTVRVRPVVEPQYSGPTYRYETRRGHHRRSTGKSVAIVAGSAGVGAAIGAIAGGGKGAGIGALAGGAGGFIYDRLTHNR